MPSSREVLRYSSIAGTALWLLFSPGLIRGEGAPVPTPTIDVTPTTPFDVSATYSISKDGKTVLKNGEPLAEVVPLPDSVKINIKGGDPRPEKGIHPKEGVYDLNPAADGRSSVMVVGEVVGTGVDENTNLPCVFVVVRRSGMADLKIKLVSFGAVAISGQSVVDWGSVSGKLTQGKQLMFAVRPKLSDSDLQATVDYYNPRGLKLTIGDMKAWNNIASEDIKNSKALKKYGFNRLG